MVRFLFVLLVLCCGVAKAETTQQALEKVMQENLDACTHEDLPRLMATMSVEMPTRELFMEQCRQEWAQSDCYHKLESVKVVKWAGVRAPYALAIVVQTIQPQQHLTAEEPETTADDSLSHLFQLRTSKPTTWQPILFKREKGKWKVVACLAEPQPLDGAGQSPDCPDGNCQWPAFR